jgi:hypothetical protein
LWSGSRCRPWVQIPRPKKIAAHITPYGLPRTQIRLCPPAIGWDCGRETDKNDVCFLHFLFDFICN